jgi:hypothetical protein
MMNTTDLQQLVTALTVAKIESEKLRATLDADTAQLHKDQAQIQVDAANFGIARAKRPSSLMAPLMVFYDDIGCRWAVSHGPVSEAIIAMLPAHITETGVTAYGATPEEAMLNFDKIWLGDDDVENYT